VNSGFGHAAGRAAARRCLRFLVNIFIHHYNAGSGKKLDVNLKEISV